jgi:ABC-2 type transport system permease protein
LPLLNSVVLVFAAVVGGMTFLAIGQFLVAMIQGSESVSSAARLLYFPLAIIGSLGEMGLFGATLQKIVIWSPFGVTKEILAAAIVLHTDQNTWLALLVSLGYCIFFAGLGIRFFRWTV